MKSIPRLLLRIHLIYFAIYECHGNITSTGEFANPAFKWAYGTPHLSFSSNVTDETGALYYAWALDGVNKVDVEVGSDKTCLCKEMGNIYPECHCLFTPPNYIFSNMTVHGITSQSVSVVNSGGNIIMNRNIVWEYCTNNSMGLDVVELANEFTSCAYECTANAKCKKTFVPQNTSVKCQADATWIFNGTCEKSRQSNGGQTAGIVIGVLLGVVLIVMVILWILGKLCCDPPGEICGEYRKGTPN